MAFRRAFATCACLVAVLHVVQAVEPSRPSFSDILHKKQLPAGTVATASVQEDYYEHYGLESKEVCLQEVEMKYCDTDEGANGTGYFWT